MNIRIPFISLRVEEILGMDSYLASRVFPRNTILICLIFIIPIPIRSMSIFDKLIVVIAISL